MRRLLPSVSAILVLALGAAGCAQRGREPKAREPAQLRASAAALSHVHSVAFHATVTLSVSGKPSGSAASASALTGKPTTLDISGIAAKSGASGVVDARFTLQNSLLPLNGELRTAGGRTVYDQAARTARPGWKVYSHSQRAPDSKRMLSQENSKDATAAARGFSRLNPFTLLTEHDPDNEVAAFGPSRPILPPRNLVAAVESLVAGPHVAAGT